MRLEIGADPLEQAYAEFLVRHLAAAEAQRDLRLVAFAQEPDQVAQLDLVVELVRTGPELHFLDLDLLELELRLVLLLRLPVLELAEVHDPANRRLRHRGDLDQIELRGFRTYQSDLRRVDFAVDPLCFFLSYWLISSCPKTNRAARVERAARRGSALASRRDLLAESRQQGLDGHRPQVLAAAGTHGYQSSLHLLVTDDQLVRQLLQAMFSNFIGYFLVAQIGLDAQAGSLQTLLEPTGVRRLAVGDRQHDRLDRREP